MKSRFFFVVALMGLVALLGCGDSGTKPFDPDAVAKDEARKSIALYESTAIDAVKIGAKDALQKNQVGLVGVVLEDKLMSSDDKVRKSGEDLLVECWGGDYVTQQVKKLKDHSDPGVRDSARRVCERMSWKTAENASDLAVKVSEKLCEVADVAKNALAKADSAASFTEVYSLSQRVQFAEMKLDTILKKDLPEVSAKADSADRKAEEAQKSVDTMAQLLCQRIGELDMALSELDDQMIKVEVQQRTEAVRARLVADGKLSAELAKFGMLVDREAGKRLLSVAELHARISALEAEKKAAQSAKGVRCNSGQWQYNNGCRWYRWSCGRWYVVN